MANTHTGSCYCGAVELEIGGDPVNMGYCHCDSCRRYSGMPVNAFTLWKAEDVKVTKGMDTIGRFKASEMSVRRP